MAPVTHGLYRSYDGVTPGLVVVCNRTGSSSNTVYTRRPCSRSPIATFKQSNLDTDSDALQSGRKSNQSFT